MSVLAFTFGVKELQNRQIFDEQMKRNFCAERKERSDKGQTVFNCKKKRKNTFTALNMYKMKRARQFQCDSSRLDEIELKMNSLH